MKRKVKAVRRSSKATPRTKRGRWLTEKEFVRLTDSLREAQETLDAIRGGEVDALVVNGPHGEHIYSLSGADEPYRVYVERMQEGAVTISSDGLILYANQRFADMAMRPLEQVISAKASDFFNSAAWREMNSVFRSQMEVVKCETNLQQAGEQQLPVNLSASRFPSKGQNVMCLVVTDLSALKQNEELHLAKEVAEKANQAKDTFLAALSHELRTPLNPVLILASESAANPDLSPRVRTDFATICRNIELEARLIDDLLDLTRISHGKLALSLSLVDGNSVVKSAIATVQPEIDAKQIAIVLDLEHKPVPLKADAVRLQQVFWNVLKNAVKFTPENGQIKISTRSSHETRQLLVDISDTGIGMTGEEIGRIFEAFAQGDHSKQLGVRRFGGLGLGLSISKMIVKMHSGDIRAHSGGCDKGATFTIALPLIHSLPNDPDHGNNGFSENRLTKTADRIKILLVEDHEPTRDALARLLLRRNHSVAIAVSAREARMLAEKNTFDLVISDIGLPDESGFDLMKELNQRYSLRGIALTGYGSEEDRISSKRSGFLSHLTKPIRMESLDATLAMAMSEVESPSLNT